MGIPGGRKANFSDPRQCFSDSVSFLSPFRIVPDQPLVYTENEALIAAFRARVKVCEDNGRIFDRLRLVREDMRYLCAAVPG